MAKDLVNKLANTFRFDELQSAIHVDGGAANGLPQSACHAYLCVICCLLRAPGTHKPKRLSAGSRFHELQTPTGAMRFAPPGTGMVAIIGGAGRWQHWPRHPCSQD